MEYKTAHDVAADWSWEAEAVGFKVKGGRVVYEQALYPEGGSGKVRFSRLVPSSFGAGWVHQINRYVDPSTEIELVRE